MKIVAVRVPEEMKEKMKAVSEDWSQYLRSIIQNRILGEEQKNLLKRVDAIMKNVPTSPRGTGAKQIRKDRNCG